STRALRTRLDRAGQAAGVLCARCKARVNDAAGQPDEVLPWSEILPFCTVEELTELERLTVLQETIVQRWRAAKGKGATPGPSGASGTVWSAWRPSWTPGRCTPIWSSWMTPARWPSVSPATAEHFGARRLWPWPLCRTRTSWLSVEWTRTW